ncbi:unnamed protein product [Prunus brigantina]
MAVPTTPPILQETGETLCLATDLVRTIIATVRKTKISHQVARTPPTGLATATKPITTGWMDPCVRSRASL